MFRDEDLINLLFEPLDWDKKSYKFNRGEKDMSPYSIYNTDKSTTIVHNVLGVDKRDLKLIRKSENGIVYILIEGKTKDAFTGKEYSVSSRFALDDTQLDLSNISSTMNNGLLYIVIPAKAQREEKITEEIEIL